MLGTICCGVGMVRWRNFPCWVICSIVMLNLEAKSRLLSIMKNKRNLRLARCSANLPRGHCDQFLEPMGKVLHIGNTFPEDKMINSISRTPGSPHLLV